MNPLDLLIVAAFCFVTYALLVSDIALKDTLSTVEPKRDLDALNEMVDDIVNEPKSDGYDYTWQQESNDELYRDLKREDEEREQQAQLDRERATQKQAAGL